MVEGLRETARKVDVGSSENPFATGGEAHGSRVGDPITFGAPITGGALEIAKPPVSLLAVAAATAVAGIGLGAIGSDSWIALVGWVFAGPLAIGVLAFYVRQDTSRRAMATYLSPTGIGAMYTCVAVLVVIGIIVSALGVAYWVGHL